MKGYIYKHTNIATGRSYIGQTILKPTTRWGQDGSNYKSNKAFYRDIVRYGWDNFTHEILEEITSSSKKDLKKKLTDSENFYINKHKTMLTDFGYNTAVGTPKKLLRLSVAAKRYINKLMSDGYTLDQAHELYLKNRRKTKKRRGGK